MTCYTVVVFITHKIGLENLKYLIVSFLIIGRKMEYVSRLENCLNFVTVRFGRPEIPTMKINYKQR